MRNLELTTIGKDHHTMEELSLIEDYKMKIKIEATKKTEQEMKVEG